ncbi:MAG: hypothetical protein KH230_04660 [Enterocloster asparagiformis]|nr:hypothetical protein [Enterocloster asparagiformis]
MRRRLGKMAVFCTLLLTALTVSRPAAGTSFAQSSGSKTENSGETRPENQSGDQKESLAEIQNQNTQKIIRQTTIMTAQEREVFVKPPEYYTDEAGGRYRLADWNVECIPGGTTSREAKKEMVYRSVEGVQVIPWQITVQEEQDGEVTRGRLEMTEKTVLEETWSDDFSIPVTFHAYGAEQYELGEITIEAGEQFPPAGEYRQELLRILGLKDSDYLVEDMHWNGEPYTDESGEVCRNALAVGKKRVADYRVVYAGRISQPVPDSYRLNTLYRLDSPAVDPTVPVVGETAAELEIPPEKNTGEKIWYWIRSGVVVTIAAGLFAILLGTIILLAAWRREEREGKTREKCRRST